MSSDTVISLESLGKCYQIYDKPRDRLLQMLFRSRKRFYREFWALRDIDLHVASGEVIGVIGSNGAGKSTLLQLICGTLSPTCGEVKVKGRVAALLELGAGFNPEFTGRENIYLSAAVTGMARDEVRGKFDEIVEFSGIGQFIDQPVKTYSSGMYVRLAFSVAINVDPDVLIIDEALSVGDGAFARRSFERVMALKDKGKTILFCSHSMYQVEAICNRVIWLEQGTVRMIGRPAEVVVGYNNEIEAFQGITKASEICQSQAPLSGGSGSIRKITVLVDGKPDVDSVARSRQSIIEVSVEFFSDPQLPPPSVAVGFTLMDGSVIAGTSTHIDGIQPERNIEGRGQVTIRYDQIPFLKGQYVVVVYLMCERGLHVYDHVLNCAVINVVQDNLEQGLVSLGHQWSRC